MRQIRTEDNLPLEKIATGMIDIKEFTETVRNYAAQSEKNRIEAVTKLFILQERTPLIIGAIAYDFEEILKKNYDSAKVFQEKQGKQGILPPKNGYEWFNRNPDKFPFDYKTYRKYIQYYADREGILLEDPEKLKIDVPLQHNTIIRKIEDNELREKIREEVAREGYTAVKTKEIVDKELHKEEKKQEFKKAEKKIHIDILLKGNDVIIKTDNQTHRDIANKYIIDRLQAIKQAIIDAD